MDYNIVLSYKNEIKLKIICYTKNRKFAVIGTKEFPFCHK